MQGAGQRPPVEHRELRVKQARACVAQRLGLVPDAVVALQHGDVADRVRHMREDVVVMALDRLLPFLGLAHDQPPDHHIGDPEHHQHHGHPVDRERGRHQENQRHRCREVLAHEFQPKREQRLDSAQQRVQRVRGAALMVPGERHRDDALEGLAKHAGAARMRDAVGAARHQHEGDDVERAEAGPKRKRRKRLRAFR